MVNLLENSGLRYKIIAKQLVNFMGVLSCYCQHDRPLLLLTIFITPFFEVCKINILFWEMALGVLGAFTFVCHAQL